MRVAHRFLGASTAGRTLPSSLTLALETSSPLLIGVVSIAVPARDIPATQQAVRRETRINVPELLDVRAVLRSR